MHICACTEHLFFCSYLADQCWSGGCIYLIMLRRVKRKAPPPPCDVNCSVSIPVSSDSCGNQQQGDAASEPTDYLNSKRTRKFGVISRSSFTQDNRNGTDSELHECYNGYNSFFPTNSADDSACMLSTHTPTTENPDTFHQIETLPRRLHNGGTATLPARCHSHLLGCQMDSFSSGPSSQVKPNA